MKWISGVIFLMIITACNNESKPDDDTAKLLKLHENGREFHFRKNAAGMVEQFSDEMISVNGGNIGKVDKEKDAAAFQKYFNSVKFKKWDDVTPPVIRFSGDHSLAYMIVDKMVVLETKDSTGRNIEESTHYAWVSVYRKQSDGNFMLECIASTNSPETVRLLTTNE